MQPWASLVSTYRRQVAPSQHCAAIGSLSIGSLVCAGSVTHEPERAPESSPLSTQTPLLGKTIGATGGGGGGSGMMHTVEPALAQYTPEASMLPTQHDAEPPGLLLQPEPPQVPHERAQQ